MEIQNSRENTCASITMLRPTRSGVLVPCCEPNSKQPKTLAAGLGFQLGGSALAFPCPVLIPVFDTAPELRRPSPSPRRPSPGDPRKNNARREL